MRFTLTREQQKPAGAVIVKSKDCEAIAYIFEQNGKPCAKGFAGKADKAEFYLIYKSAERRAAHVVEFFSNVKAREERRQKARNERTAFVHTLTVGTILRACWGYDQTNIDYYQVTRVIGKSVEIRAISQQREETGYMQGKCVPAPDSLIGEPMRKLVQQGNSVRIASYCSAYPVESQTVAGIQVFQESHWTAYA